LENKTESRSMK